ncbi:glycoside hydrolase family 3 C-terminal domain-containing protein [Microlunatus soli]|uniref:Exo-alpha-(1->6)-L-arabinopyranosidase n=1 Tax=Microlunatus soli TaxID=630515 RepID=A0A1H1V0C8_9ACTN|nr:glycoside hydrolase family 3 C-terminal domain-containing protein [Microlunatus soli]SDS78237.1 beta-glucosidase [Microlunatus soli]
MSDQLDVDAVLAALTLEEKASLSLGSDIWHTAPIERLGVESIMVSDGPHGLRAQFEQQTDNVGLGDSVPATCFPTAAGLASSWNRTLLRQVGEAVARECLRWQVSVLLGPGVNMKRSPLCGRNFEYLSEDPYLAGELATALVQGVQSQGIGTSLKHFAANNQETDRMRVDAEVDQRTLREIYLPAFEKVVKTARPWTVMCAYNKINGSYGSEHHQLLTEILRDEWGFDGLVVSDWGAVHDRVASLAAGLDLEMPPVLGHSDVAVVEAVRAGTLDEKLLDRTVRRVLDLVAKSRPARQDEHTVDQAEQHAFARVAARESAVLLKNDGNLLPLDPAATTRVLVVGELARTPRYQGAGSSQVNPTRVDIPLEELRALAGDAITIDYAPGYRLDEPTVDPDLRDEAVRMAQSADVVLAFVGLPDAAESEGFDRTDIDLPANQTELLAQLAEQTDRIAVLIAGGSVVEVASWQRHAATIMECWLSGQAAGGAVADLIFGVANPSGKLAETLPIRLQDNSSYLNFPGGDGTVRYGEGVFIGYRGYDKSELAVSYPFGHGLSYTTFAIDGLEVSTTGSIADGDLAVTVAVTVTNTGDRAGAEVVQVYVGDRQSAVPRPLRELKAFDKIALDPGESGTVELRLDERAFAFWSTRFDRWLVESGDFEITVGSSSRDHAASTVITIEAPRVAVPINREATLAEWLADPAARAVLQRQPKVATILQHAEPTMIKMVEQMPVSTIAGFGFAGFGPADLDRFLTEMEAE